MAKRTGELVRKIFCFMATSLGVLETKDKRKNETFFSSFPLNSYVLSLPFPWLLPCSSRVVNEEWSNEWKLKERNFLTLVHVHVGYEVVAGRNHHSLSRRKRRQGEAVQMWDTREVWRILFFFPSSSLLPMHACNFSQAWFVVFCVTLHSVCFFYRRCSSHSFWEWNQLKFPSRSCFATFKTQNIRNHLRRRCCCSVMKNKNVA